MTFQSCLEELTVCAVGRLGHLIHTKGLNLSVVTYLVALFFCFGAQQVCVSER